MATALRVQTVRYGGEAPRLLRMVSSVAAAARQLQGSTSVRELTVAIGDCGGPDGPDAVLEGPVLAEAREVLERAGVSLDYVAFDTNTGHGVGQNLLAARSPGPGRTADDEVLVLANPDTYLTPKCLTMLLGALEGGTGIAEARQIPLEHPKFFDPATGETPWASGCLMALRLALFASLGGFEPAFFLHGDDVDLSWRTRFRGFLVRHVPEAAVFHDKQLSDMGYPVAGPEEEYQAMLARLLLAHRAERHDIVGWWLDWIDVEGTSLQRDAAAEYLRRHTEGVLPATYREALGVSREAVVSVTRFDEGEYAEHRF
jgi:hypothetical protein